MNRINPLYILLFSICITFISVFKVNEIKTNFDEKVEKVIKICLKYNI